MTMRVAAAAINSSDNVNEDHDAQQSRTDTAVSAAGRASM